MQAKAIPRDSCVEFVLGLASPTATAKAERTSTFPQLWVYSMQNFDFKEIQTSRVFEDICDQIRGQLASGQLKPGAKLPGERDLAAAFGVGRPAVREALRTLEISGIVSIQKGARGGAFICEGDTQIMTKALRDFMLLGRISIDNLREARIQIWNVVVKLACQRGSPEDFDAIERHIEYIDSLTDLKPRAVAALELFSLIAAASHNEVFVLLMDSLGNIIFQVVEEAGRVHYPELSQVRRHILKALRAKDENMAMKAMEKYLTIVHAVLDTPPSRRKRTSVPSKPGGADPAKKKRSARTA
ncbi:GntR family transcriptional regulator [Bordetella petrii]|nr:GntR family transcriptional regulator [Bordetella petrii]